MENQPSEALKEFLAQEQMLKSLNKLEKEVQQKMGQKDILAQLKLDGLLFEHLYSDLMMLVKTKALDKSVLDMNVHYLELKGFLEELTQHPHQIMNPNYQVFPSEPRLYGNSPITNHRLHPGYIPVRRRLYQPDLFDTLELYPRVQQADETMMEKLMNYKADQLPGGRYWEPTGEIREIMASLKPHNDNSESVLGMNDWLTTTFPNMHQQTRSTLIEMSTNKTIEWLAKQPSDRRNLVTDFATSKRKESQKQRHQAQQALEEEYLRQREAAVAKAKVKEGKKARQKELLQEEVMIQSVEVLEQTIRVIQNLSLPERVKSSEIQKLVETQLQIRSKVLQQTDSKLSFTTKGRPRPITELIQKLKEFRFKLNYSYPKSLHIHSQLQ